MTAEQHTIAFGALGTLINRLPELKGVLRANSVLSGKRLENSAEHSWEAACMAMLLADKANAPIDATRCVNMLLIHDLVELEVGDVHALDATAKNQKIKDEAAAAKKLLSSVAPLHLGDLEKLWQEFESGHSPEARFARAIDAFLPLMHGARDGDAAWNGFRHGRNAYLAKKSAISDGSLWLWQEAVRLTEQLVDIGLLLQDAAPLQAPFENPLQVVPFGERGTLIHEGPDRAIVACHGAVYGLTSTDFSCDTVGMRKRRTGGFIADFQGINHLIAARQISFDETTYRTVLATSGLFDPTQTYLGFGAAGAQATYEPSGGEVIERMLIDGKTGLGLADSWVGWLDPENPNVAKAAPLNHAKANEFLRRDRAVYSQMAWLPQGEGSHGHSMAIGNEDQTVSVLDSVIALLVEAGISAAAIWIELPPGTQITGRMGRSEPLRPWRTIEDAQRFGLIREFVVSQNQSVLALGTVCPRYEPAWTRLSGKEKYEPRGHYHARLRGSPAQPDQFGCFHLRDAVLPPGVKITAQITPVDRYIRIQKLTETDAGFHCAVDGVQFLPRQSNPTSAGQEADL